MKIWIRRFIAYAIAVIVATIITCILATQIVLAEISSFGLPISLMDRLHSTVHDILGLTPKLIPMIGASFFVAFLVCGLLLRWVKGPRGFWYAIAGAAAITTLLIGLKLGMGAIPLAGVRHLSGLLGAALCCAIGGWCFARLSEPATQPRVNTHA